MVPLASHYVSRRGCRDRPMSLFAVTIRFGKLILLTALVVWIMQVVTWMEDGAWPPLPLSMVWAWLFGGLPDYSWKGTEDIVHWLLKQNVGLVLFPIGLGLVYLGLKRQEATEDRGHVEHIPRWDAD